MQILWRNIIAFCLALFAIVLLVKFGSAATEAFSNLGRIGSGFSRSDQASGLIVLGLIGAVLVAIVKILARGK